MKKNLAIIILFLFAILAIQILPNNGVVWADELSDSIRDQLQSIDFSELNDFLEGIPEVSNQYDFFSMVSSSLNGEYVSDYNSILDYFINLFFSGICKVVPIFISILAISIFCGIMQNSRSSFAEESVSNVTFWVCFLSIILLLSTTLIGFWDTIKNAIENIAKFSEIMSPIMLSLMVAAGGNVSASMYSPTVAFLSSGIINVVLTIVLPLIGVVTIFSIISNFSSAVKINKLIEFIYGVIKWILGITVTVFTLFLSVNGISGASHDGVTMKLAKYTISNSIPIVGGFLRDGFDVVVAGSVLIKNAIGIGGIFILFYIIIAPTLSLAAFSLMIKLVAGLIEPVTDPRLSSLCMSISKCISYLNACLLSVGFMFFITILLMTFSVNAFI